MSLLPTLTYQDKLAELRNQRTALELKSEVSSYLDYANEFLALATQYLEIDALSGYETCMRRCTYYLGMHKQETDEQTFILSSRREKILNAMPKVTDEEIIQSLTEELAEIETALQKAGL